MDRLLNDNVIRHESKLNEKINIFLKQADVTASGSLTKT